MKVISSPEEICKKGERKKFIDSLSLRKLQKIWQLPGGAEFRDRLEPAGRFVTREGRVDPVLSSFSWKFTESPWPNLCSASVSRWFCIVPGSPHGLTSRRREKERCVSRLSDGCAGPLPPRQCQYPRRPNVPASSCTPIRVYSFTVWFFPDDDSFPTFLFPTFRSPLSAFSFSSFSFPSSSSSSSSSPSEGEETAYSSFPNVVEKLVISQNFIVRISFPAFGDPESGLRNPGWNTDNCDFAAWWLFVYSF